MVIFSEATIAQLYNANSVFISVKGYSRCLLLLSNIVFREILQTPLSETLPTLEIFG